MEDLYFLLWIGFFLVVVVGGILLFLLSKFYKVEQGTLTYVRATLLTEAERRFFNALIAALPERYYLLAQVRVANLVRVKQGTGGFFWKHFSPIGMKCVDFVVVQRDTLRPALVVELDDSSHTLTERKKRDAFIDQVFSSVGMPVLHWPAQRQYNQVELTKALGAKLRFA